MVNVYPFWASTENCSKLLPVPDRSRKLSKGSPTTRESRTLLSRVIAKGVSSPVSGREKRNPQSTVTKPSVNARNETWKVTSPECSPTRSSTRVSVPLRDSTTCSVKASSPVSVTDPAAATDSLKVAESAAAVSADMSRNVPGSGTSSAASVWSTVCGSTLASTDACRLDSISRMSAPATDAEPVTRRTPRATRAKGLTFRMAWLLSFVRGLRPSSRSLPYFRLSGRFGCAAQRNGGAPRCGGGLGAWIQAVTCDPRPRPTVTSWQEPHSACRARRPRFPSHPLGTAGSSVACPQIGRCLLRKDSGLVDALGRRVVGGGGRKPLHVAYRLATCEATVRSLLQHLTCPLNQTRARSLGSRDTTKGESDDCSRVTETRFGRLRRDLSPRLPARGRLAVRLGMACGCALRISVFHDDRRGLRNTRRLPADRIAKPASPSQLDLVHRVVERRARRHHGGAVDARRTCGPPTR